ncbi:hypothetical protein B0H13DRAFT_880231, partial [Mycena leptocephala]
PYSLPHILSGPLPDSLPSAAGVAWRLGRKVCAPGHDPSRSWFVSSLSILPPCIHSHVLPASHFPLLSPSVADPLLSIVLPPFGQVFLIRHRHPTPQPWRARLGSMHHLGKGPYAAAKVFTAPSFVSMARRPAAFAALGWPTEAATVRRAEVGLPVRSMSPPGGAAVSSGLVRSQRPPWDGEWVIRRGAKRYGPALLAGVRSPGLVLTARDIYAGRVTAGGGREHLLILPYPAASFRFYYPLLSFG